MMDIKFFTLRSARQSAGLFAVLLMLGTTSVLLSGCSSKEAAPPPTKSPSDPTQIQKEINEDKNPGAGGAGTIK